ncbi:MAG: KH domain-containing protein [Desulfobacteraceae bacterium]|nr:MAG: KH domain-containing protein [Desulfobacteraceae bacterium]
MKQTQEFEGRDVGAAIKNACTELGISKDDLDYEVITTGTTGIFGIVGRKDARIRAFVSDDTPVSSDSQMDDADFAGVQSIVDEAFGQETRREDHTETISDLDEEAEEEGELDDAVDVTQESIDLGVEALQKMADLITDDASVTASTDRDQLTLTITGGNAGILIGRKGQTLDAMQFLTDKMINRKSDARVRVKVDIEGYMETRKSNLESLAFKMADKAKKTGRPATINQMSAQDRRIVHLALKDDSRVRTQSMGDGYYRRLVIFPKKNNNFRGKRRFKK